jgi:O-antigen/teichoic acid export membrane protein
LVVLPPLSAAQQRPEDYRALYAGAAAMLGWCAMPLAAVVYVTAPNLVLLLLGGTWLDSVDVFRSASLGVLAVPMMAMTNWLLVSSGRTGHMFRYGVVGASLDIGTAVLVAPFGPNALALGRSAVAVVLLLGGLAYATRNSAVDFRLITRALKWPLVATITAGVAGYLSSALLSDQPAMLQLAGVSLSMVAATLALAVTSGELRRLRTTLRGGKHTVGDRPSTDAAIRDDSIGHPE